MPRFSDREKEQIRDRLLAQGEKLFAARGIKKVTIDDLAEAAGIAKASFYKFYEGKEHLYLDIVQHIQRKIFSHVNGLLDANAGLPGKERVLQVFEAMFQMTFRYPILTHLDTATTDLITRRVSKERLVAYGDQNVDAVHALYQHGIHFACDAQTLSCAFQALYQCWIALQDKGEDMQSAVIKILLRGILDQTVTEE